MRQVTPKSCSPQDPFTSPAGGPESAYYSVADIAMELAGGGSSGGRYSRVGSFSVDAPPPEAAAFHARGAAYDVEDGLGDRDMEGGDGGGPGTDQSFGDVLLEMAGIAALGPPLEPMGIALLHPNLVGEAGPSFTRILGKSRCVRSPLLWLLQV